MGWGEVPSSTVLSSYCGLTSSRPTGRRRLSQRGPSEGEDWATRCRQHGGCPGGQVCHCPLVDSSTRTASLPVIHSLMSSPSSSTPM